MKKLRKRHSGEGYIDVCVLVVCAMLVLALAVRILPVFVAKQQLDTYAVELVREAEISGRVGTETSRRAAALTDSTGLDPNIRWSKTGRMEQVRLVKEMRNADEQRGRAGHAVRPRYMLWENVPGAFSSGTPKGEDFRIVLEEIVRVKCGSAYVPGPYPWPWQSAGRILLGTDFSLAWRCLDAQYWGVAQRRKRIFLVADFAGRTADKILFIPEGMFGDPAPSF